MISSTQITNEIMKHPNPVEAAFKVWLNTRYLVAQEPASDDYTDTKIGYFQGKMVVPGPKYNPKLSPGLTFQALNVNDFQALMSKFHIRFIDNQTTENADESTRKAIFTVMTDTEADSYEKELRKQQNVNRSKTIPS